MYSGEEKLTFKGMDLPFTVRHFWQNYLSNFKYPMTRGSFAEYIVKCALNHGGVEVPTEVDVGFEAFDIIGPIIKSTNEHARIEVKSSSFYNPENKKYSERKKFSIAPKKVLEYDVYPEGDYKVGSPRQRNNDIYVFALFKSKSEEDDILDMSLWEFYVLPTYRIECDSYLSERFSITLTKVKELCKTRAFDEVTEAVVEACSEIPPSYPRKSWPSTQ